MKNSLSLMISLCLLAPSVCSAKTPTGGGKINPPTDTISQEQRNAIQSILATNISKLQKQRAFDSLQSVQTTQNALQFPLRRASNNAKTGFYGISNYVDLDPQPSRTLDWTCGARTYDGHHGIDYFLWPFEWLTMDQEAIDIVAAAPGVIIGKSNGYSDRSCPTNRTNEWNAVYVRHADGSVAWYGHMKNNSLTSKAVGASVATGEFLGKVGSSGYSTGPHLHFELHDETNRIIEPNSNYSTCHKEPSLWAEQPPYYESRINIIATHSAPPDFRENNCPNPIAEAPNFSNSFKPGSTVFFAGYYQDQLPHQLTNFTAIRPDGTTFRSWSFDMSEATTEPHYAASYWYWSHAIPANEMTGSWKFRATYMGKTYEHAFVVSNVAGQTLKQNDFNGNGKSDLFWRHQLSGRNIIWESANYNNQWGPGDVQDSNWKIVGSGDFDSDGKADILWRNYVTGKNIIWPSGDGNQKVYTTTITDVNWKIVAVGDFDADGVADIFWRHAITGQNVIWWSGEYANRANDQQVGLAWQVVGTADFNGDGKTDVLWRNTQTGANIVWWSGKYAGFTHLTGVTNQAWKVVATGDFNGDGRADIFWRNDVDGRNIIWWAGNYATQSPEQAIRLDWNVVTSGDYDGDGKTDIIWRNRVTGQNVWWPAAQYAQRTNLVTITDQNWVISR